MKTTRWAAIVAFCISAATPAAPAFAADAPSAEAVASARKLFAEALKDEQDKKFADALEKFRSVQRVKNTIPVRYRIASCLEGTGKLRAAGREFASLTAEHASDSADAAVIEDSKQRLAAIERRTPHLAVRLSSRAPADSSVTLDGEALSGGAVRGEPIPVDPGDHEVRGTATGAAPFASKVHVEGGEQLSVLVPLDPAPETPPKSETPTAAPAGGSRTLGYVLVAVGGALAVASIVSFVVRHGDISDLNTACPGGNCPSNQRNELTSKHSQAMTLGTLGYVFAGGAVVAGGLGLYVLLKPRAAGDATTSAKTAGTDMALGLRGTF